MANGVLSWKPESDQATITGGAVAATLPLPNLKTMNLDEVCRFTDVNDAFLVADLGSAKPITQVYLGAHNGTTAAVVRVRGADSEANLTAAPGLDQSGLAMVSGGAVTDRHFFHLLFSSAQTYRWWRIDLTDAANPDGYIDLGRLYLGTAWQFANNVSLGGGLGFIDASHVQRSATGQAFVDISNARRVVRERLDFQSEDQIYSQFYELQRQVGKALDVLFIRNPSATTHLQRRSVYGLLKSLNEIVQPEKRIYSAVITIEELMP